MHFTTTHHASPRRIHTRGLALAGAALLGLLGLTACSSSSSTESSPSESTDCPVTVDDGWVKAADKGMTAAFGTLTNGSAEAVTITAASTPASSSMELHEVVESDGEMVMQPVAGGFSVSANGTLTLEPAGLHLMLMDVTEPIEAGEDITFTLTCSGGSTTGFTAQARTFTGAGEQYQPGSKESMAPSQSMP